MTVATTPNEIDFAGAGSVAPLSFPYSVHSSAELYVYLVTAGVETLRTVITDYTVSVAGDFSSATITPTAPFAAAANGKTIRIRRTLPFTQPLDLVNAARLNSAGIDLAFDRAVMRDQQLHTRLTKAESALASDIAAAASAAAAAVSAAAALASQSAAATSATAASASATAAAASQSAAASSASGASTSATAAAASATSASGSATTATTQASNAAASATSASGSATTATTQATAASASATAAAASASSASGSASTATTQASAASASATAAASSATSASGSATTAATQASAAAASAAAALVSEGIASAAASAASSSASAASASASSASTSASTATTQASAASASATAAAASATAAAASYDAFDDRYLGSKASDPSVDNDGNALIEGALYWNSTDKEMKVWDGAVWVTLVGGGGGGGAVSSVFGRTGSISATAGDYSASLVTNDSGVSGTNVDDALDTLDAAIGALSTTVTGQSASATQTLTNKTIDASNNTISNLTTAMFAANVVDTDATLAANSNTRLPSQSAVKSYIDNAVTGLKWKPSVVVRTTANITLSGEQTIDGVLTSASRVAVMNQSTASQNGIYVSAAGAWSRVADADTGAELVGATFFIEQGTTYADTIWTVTTNAITLGSTSVAFAQVSGAGTYSATGGVTLSSNQFSITTNGITDAMLRQSAGLSVVGRSANTTGNVADITAANDGEVLRRSGTAIGFGTIATAGIANDAVTYAKMQNVSATSRVLGRKTAGAGDTEEITLSELLDFIGSAAQGDILFRGASAWSRLAAGTSGYFLKSNGAGADLSYAAAGGVDVIAAGTVSGTPSAIDVNTSLSAYKKVEFNLVAASHNSGTATNLTARFSEDGGSTFLAADGAQFGNNNGSAAYAAGGGTTSLVVNPSTLNNAAIFNVLIELWNPGSTVNKRVRVCFAYASGANEQSFTFEGYLTSTAPINFLRYVYAAGSFDAGEYVAYGYK